jgi:hypothetical protein
MSKFNNFEDALHRTITELYALAHEECRKERPHSVHCLVAEAIRLERLHKKVQRFIQN